MNRYIRETLFSGQQGELLKRYIIAKWAWNYRQSCRRAGLKPFCGRLLRESFPAIRNWVVTNLEESVGQNYIGYTEKISIFYGRRQNERWRAVQQLCLLAEQKMHSDGTSQEWRNLYLRRVQKTQRECIVRRNNSFSGEFKNLRNIKSGMVSWKTFHAFL